MEKQIRELEDKNEQLTVEKEGLTERVAELEVQLSAITRAMENIFAIAGAF